MTKAKPGTIQTVATTDAPAAIGTYSQAVSAGNTILTVSSRHKSLEHRMWPHLHGSP